MKNKYIVYIVIVLIFVIGISIYIFFNNQNNKKYESVYLKITSDNNTISGNYKKGDTFQCTLLGTEFNFKIDDINDNKIKLSSSNYGLFPKREDGSISLIEKIKNFELYKGKPLFLQFQATDVSKYITIIWE